MHKKVELLWSLMRVDLIPMRTVTEWRVCMDFRVECLDKEGPLSDAFMDSMFDGLEGMF